MDQILTWCSCKAGAKTLGGCVHACAILYHLTVVEGNDDQNRPNSAKRRVKKTNIIDLTPYKAQKKQNMEDSEIQQIEETEMD